jgi:ferredoxin
MAYWIPEGCIYCGNCMEECPNEAIYENEAADKFDVDPEKCTECVGFHSEPQCAATCSVELPEPDPNHQETKEQLLEKFKKQNPDKEPVL